MESGSGAASSAVGPAETDSPVASSAAEHGVGGSSFGAAEPSRRDCGDDSEEDSEGSEEDSEDENGTNSDGSLSDDCFPSSAGRVHLEASNSNGSLGSADSPFTTPGPPDLEPADALSEPATSLSGRCVQERAAAMFVVGIYFTIYCCAWSRRPWA